MRPRRCNWSAGGWAGQTRAGTDWQQHDAGQWLLPTQQARTALNAIRGFTELLLTGGAGLLSAESLDHLRQIAVAGGALEDALRLIERYLPYPERQFRRQCRAGGEAWRAGS